MICPVCNEVWRDGCQCTVFGARASSLGQLPTSVSTSDLALSEIEKLERRLREALSDNQRMRAAWAQIEAQYMAGIHWMPDEWRKLMSDALGAPTVDDGDQVRSAWAEFGRWCLKEMRYPCPSDIDGGAAQDEAERLGLLIRVSMSAPCGENCYCSEFHSDAPWECLREAPTVDDGDRGTRTSVAPTPAPEDAGGAQTQEKP